MSSDLKFCRTCKSSTDLKKIKSIDGLLEHLFKLFYIEDDTLFTKYICGSCIKIVTDFAAYRKKVIATSDELKWRNHTAWREAVDAEMQSSFNGDNTNLSHNDSVQLCKTRMAKEDCSKVPQEKLDFMTKLQLNDINVPLPSTRRIKPNTLTGNMNETKTKSKRLFDESDSEFESESETKIKVPKHSSHKLDGNIYPDTSNESSIQSDVEEKKNPMRKKMRRMTLQGMDKSTSDLSFQEASTSRKRGNSKRTSREASFNYSETDEGADASDETVVQRDSHNTSTEERKKKKKKLVSKHNNSEQTNSSKKEKRSRGVGVDEVKKALEDISLEGDGSKVSKKRKRTSAELKPTENETSMANEGREKKRRKMKRKSLGKEKKSDKKKSKPVNPLSDSDSSY